jgi:riboflavin biosynthesis pyrimidine reductase
MREHQHQQLRRRQHHTIQTILLLLPCICSSLSLRGVTLKIAVDANGGVAERAASAVGDVVSARFTCSESLDLVHRLRRDADAILVGKQTVIDDNPSLLVRRGVVLPTTGRQQPLRVILDTHLSLLHDPHDHPDQSSSSSPPTSSPYQIFTDGYPTLVYYGATSSSATAAVAAAKDFLGIDSTTVLAPIETTTAAESDGGRAVLSIPHVWRELQTRHNIQHLMVEGGPAVARAFLHHQLVDRCLIVQATTVSFRNPLPSGIDDAVLSAAGLTQLGQYTLGGGVDEVECWSKTTDWPTTELTDWP